MKRTGEGLLQAERDRRLAERRQAGEKCIAGKDARMKLITLEFRCHPPDLSTELPDSAAAHRFLDHFVGVIYTCRFGFAR